MNKNEKFTVTNFLDNWDQILPEFFKEVFPSEEVLDDPEYFYDTIWDIWMNEGAGWDEFEESIQNEEFTKEELIESIRNWAKKDDIQKNIDEVRDYLKNGGKINQKFKAGSQDPAFLYCFIVYFLTFYVIL